MAKRRRFDAFPEFLNYVDKGCEVAPACLACPLPQCRYDGPASDRFAAAMLRRNAERDADILASRAAGERPRHIAERLGVSRRTVFRVLKERAATLSE